MNILSLFDGMSCGQISLIELGFKINKYYASEIEKAAIKVSSTKFPNTIHLGSVINIDISKLEPIDLLIGGSPCNDLSSSGSRNGLSTTCKIEILTLEQYLQLKEEGFIFKGQSYLFWEYIRILTEIRKYNPNVKFLLENVVMDQKWKEIFDKTLGVEGVLINSNLVSAQNRKRFYWTNICTIEQPEDLNINLQDILEETLDWNKASIVGRRMTSDGVRKDGEKDLKLYQCLEVKKTMQNKSNCLTTFSKDNVLTPMEIGRHYDCYNRKLPYRNYTIKEYCRLQNVSDDYFYDNDKLIVSVSSLRKMLGNGWTINVIKHILKNLKI